MKPLKQINIIIFSLVFIMIAMFANSMANANPAFSPEQTKNIEKVVHDYLINNPELMLQVFQKLQQKQQAQLQQRAEAAIKKNAKILFDSAQSPVVGNKKGSVTLVEFFDYQCPHCKDVTPVVNNLKKANPNLRIIFKEFPIFPASDYVSKAALASMKQGKYYAFHEALMKKKNLLTKAKVAAAAKSVGLDMQQLTKDMKSKTITKEIQQNIDLAQKIGIRGTPSFIISNAKIGSPDMKNFFVPGVGGQKILQNLINQAASGS